MLGLHPGVQEDAPEPVCEVLDVRVGEGARLREEGGVLAQPLLDARVQEVLGDVQAFRRHLGHGNLARHRPIMDSRRASGNP